MNTGKRFEQQIRDSVPGNVYYYRLRDGTGAWSKNDGNVRFQQSNVCDCLLFAQNRLFMLELKSCKGKSFPFSKIRNDQLSGLIDAQKYDGITAGIVINFNEHGRTFYIDIDVLERKIALGSKKSINLSELELLGMEIPGTRKRVNYKWNLSVLWKGGVQSET